MSQNKKPSRWMTDIPEDWLGCVKAQVFGEWHHVCSPHELGLALTTKGEICVTSQKKPIFWDPNLDWDDSRVIVRYRGRVSFLFPEDCYSYPKWDKSGERYATSNSCVSIWDEGWLTPYKAKPLAVYIGKGIYCSRDEVDKLIAVAEAYGAKVFNDLGDFFNWTYRPAVKQKAIGQLKDIWPKK